MCLPPHQKRKKERKKKEKESRNRSKVLHRLYIVQSLFKRLLHCLCNLHPIPLPTHLPHTIHQTLINLLQLLYREPIRPLRKSMMQCFESTIIHNQLSSIKCVPLMLLSSLRMQKFLYTHLAGCGSRPWSRAVERWYVWLRP
ncbi:hypothetical protein I7I50_05121 [Histoplasma capsulatum G186AR]|uniref:Uncharacterized protein n=1 Tax=Ajellomyces capsulatus TaxID=5037 RepID=A0A8H7ZAR7_AJECA|nr:hypothetical protein I7I52_03379 [Histoplasma capsulatum]QSS75846.1 hypothetical protein I7I50_05121 [Histoplasma capsulatum G186AR]